MTTLPRTDLASDPGKGNLRGAALMVVAMAGFALEDMMIKLMAGALPVGQILVLLGAGGALAFGLLLTARGERIVTPDLWRGSVLARNLCEAVGTFGFVTAIALIPISLASTILMAVPLVLTVAAVFLLGERVGWRRWVAVSLGFLGVLMVLRPGFEGFDPASLFALLGVLGLAFRDIAARKVPPQVSSLHLAVWGFAVLVPLGLIVMATAGTPWVALDARLGAMLAAAIVIGLGAYYTLVAATRLGEVSAVVPFRYSRIVFAMIVGVVVFAERPDALTLLGATLIVATGLYAAWRERLSRR